MQSVEVLVFPSVVAIEQKLHHLLGRGSVRYQEGLVLGLKTEEKLVIKSCYNDKRLSLYQRNSL